ncbi:large conductance mechanosensitive channel protein MscL [Candidatus Saccharibacteria bacterium]|nr:large conductance mechanosensitive channel protein MscL [Candidatus Saccharibacteria bacterium]MBI2285769.1 large conductance mechanosensitive channel protein MscL [Candidatus Saccharibacteria bacterium]
MLSEFRKFILRGNVVDLAVGIVIGAAFTSVVNAFVKDIVNPIVELFYQGGKFSSATLTLGDSKFQYGDLLNNLLSFLIVAAVVFFFVVKPINHLTERFTRSKDTGEPTTRKCPECLSEISKEATRCKFCTTKISAPR